ncbi:hypothetical protein [Lewinella sp. 4G2]|uniref:hypothetical protein n=1 Tax=Lewinella sp. 4G2 TaxID=1803372 RepID=UPI0007B4E599|nr:hypothetical protein [Lewinella sp. 4G2]OAV44330.1 hypothetical protein A3850_007410 [Lewinella sp. 4G2]
MLFRPSTSRSCLPILLCAGIWALAQVPGNGQALRTTATGEKIIVQPDGSARYFNDGQPVTGAAGDDAAYTVLSVNIEPLGDALTPTEADLRHIAERRLNLARTALSLASTRASAATTNREQLENEMDAARRAGNLTELSALSRRFNLAKDLEIKAQDDEADAQQQVGVIEGLLESGKFVKAYNEDRRRTAKRLESVDRPTGQDRTLSLLYPKEAEFTGYGPAKARDGIREPLPCRQVPAPKASNGAQPQTPLLPFFSFTEESLRPFLEGKEYLTASAYVSRDQNQSAFLHLQFGFSNAVARNAYGTLPQGPSLSIHFLDGRSLVLSGERESVGIVNHLQQTLNYDVDYPLKRNELSTLQREAIDYVRVFWAGGYEEYPILRVDAIKLLCRCL